MFSSDTIAFLVLGLVAASNMLLGATVYFGDTKSVTRKYFFLLAISITVFSIFTYAAYAIQSITWTIWLLRGTLFTAVPFATFFFLLAVNFPSDTLQISKRELNWVYLCAFVAMTATISPFVFSGIDVTSGHIQPVVGYGMPIFATIAVFLDVSGLWALSKKTLKARAEDRAPFLYLLGGFLIMLFLILVFSFFLPVYYNNIKFIPYSITFSFPFIAFAAYAIGKYHLLNVKVIATEVVLFFLTVTSLLEVLFSTTITSAIFRLSVFVLVLCFGVLLIKGIRREVKQTEELKRLSEALENANQKLKQVDQAKSEFLSVASHQLRTPLTAIKGYASMLLEGDFGNIIDPQKHNIQIIYDSAQRLADLVADLLDLSRIESGRMEFDFAPVNLCDVVESVMQELVPKAKARNLLLYFDNVNRFCPEIRADKEKIRQVVINLIDNALKYTVQGSVTVQLLKNGNELQLSIKDTGIGVDPAEKDKLFEKFFRTKAANELTREGTGLGIYVVKKIVDSHGGRIWFDSGGVNQGTTFYVTLPVPRGEIKEERVKIDAMDAF